MCSAAAPAIIIIIQGLAHPPSYDRSHIVKVVTWPLIYLCKGTCHLIVTFGIESHYGPCGLGTCPVQGHVTSLEITPSIYFLAYTGQENLSPKATRLAVYFFLILY